MREVITTAFEVLGGLAIAAGAALAGVGDLHLGAGIAAGGAVLLAESALAQRFGS